MRFSNAVLQDKSSSWAKTSTTQCLLSGSNRLPSAYCLGPIDCLVSTVWVQSTAQCLLSGSNRLILLFFSATEKYMQTLFYKYRFFSTIHTFINNIITKQNMLKFQEMKDNDNNRILSVFGYPRKPEFVKLKLLAETYGSHFRV